MPGCPRVRLTAGGVLIDGRLRAPDVTARRQVHVVGAYVVKVDGGTQNWKEWQNWNCIEHRDRRYFAPVLAYGPREPDGARSWLIQRRILFRAGPPSDWARSKVAQLAASYHLRDLLTGDESCGQSNHARNWGVARNGTPKIFDYAE